MNKDGRLIYLANPGLSTTGVQALSIHLKSSNDSSWVWLGAIGTIGSTTILASKIRPQVVSSTTLRTRINHEALEAHPIRPLQH
jgi:hypothetical protein